MERSREQLKRVERLSRQTRHYRTHLNQMCQSELEERLAFYEKQRDQSILRSYARRQLEEERQHLVHVTVAETARERERRPSSSAKSKVSSISPTTNQTESCRLFSAKCRLYPCQPVHYYQSFLKKEHDQCLMPQEEEKENQADDLFKHWSTRSQEKKYYQSRRQITLAQHNQNHLLHRYVSLQRTQARLDEESRRLHERLAEKKLFGRAKEHRHQLSQDIQRHLLITAKFCA